MRYNVSIILDPLNYERGIQNQISKFNLPKQSLFDDPTTYLEECEKIVSNYKTESSMFGTFDFKGSVIKYKEKPKFKQIKLEITSQVAEYILNNQKDLHRSALVLDEYCAD